MTVRIKSYARVIIDEHERQPLQVNKYVYKLMKKRLHGHVMILYGN